MFADATERGANAVNVDLDPALAADKKAGVWLNVDGGGRAGRETGVEEDDLRPGGGG